MSQARRLFRSILPSWKLFVELAPSARLHHRVVSDSGDDSRSSEWIDTLPAPAPRGALSLLINTDHNRRLAFQSLVDQLAEDVSELPVGDAAALTQLVSYALVLNLVRARADAGDGRLQFKLTWGMPGAASEAREDVMISAEHTREAAAG